MLNDTNQNEITNSVLCYTPIYGTEQMLRGYLASFSNNPLWVTMQWFDYNILLKVLIIKYR